MIVAVRGKTVRVSHGAGAARRELPGVARMVWRTSRRVPKLVVPTGLHTPNDDLPEMQTTRVWVCGLGGL
jgi:hypothetical protein